jgi:hypothetical protein
LTRIRSLEGSLTFKPKHFWFPGGLFFAHKSPETLLLRTPSGTLIIKELGYSDPNPAQAALRITPRRIAWREVSAADAFIWLQRHSRRHARRLFPELAAQQREH